MFNLYEIVQNAQDGQAVDNLAKQFNISPGEADAAVKALLPALSTAFLQRTAEPAAFGSILGALGDPQHAAAFADPDAALSSETTRKGAAALQQLFGSPDTSAQIAQHAAGVAGLPPALIQQMAPVIASLILGGLSKGLANQGLGGVFGQLAGAAEPGGLGSILGSLLGGAPAAQAQPAGGAQQVNPGAGNNPLDGLGGLGSILGGLLGGAPPAQAQPQGAPQANPQINPDAPGGAGGLGGLGGLGGVLQSILGGLLSGKSGGPTPQEGAAPQGPGGIDPGAVQSGLDALIKMLQPGTPPPPTGQQAGLQNEINAILTGKRS
jgi:hypothetical protein